MGINDGKVIITIDTEVGERGRDITGAFEKLVLGEINGTYWGVPKIVEMFNNFGFKGEFFVDVYEKTVFGEDKYIQLCKNLHKQGHGVQLHTHPSYAYDPKRINMHQYSLKEQIKIISDGIGLINDWIGEKPIAHRAGNYGADDNTLVALAANNIKIDSSFFLGHKNCKINLNIWNKPTFYKGVLEIPITVFRQSRRIFGIPIFFLHRWVKLDINWIKKRELMEKQILELTQRFPYVILFLHSSSFVNRQPLFKPNLTELKAFQDILTFIKNHKIEVTTFKEILKPNS